MNDFGSRLREERERIGLNQTEFAEKCGVKKLAQSNYEKGVRNPDSLYLAAASVIGVDVLYLITGKRSVLAATSEVVDREISKEKQALLNAFDEMSPEQRRAILEVGRVISQPKSDKLAG